MSDHPDDTALETSLVPDHALIYAYAVFCVNHVGPNRVAPLLIQELGFSPMDFMIGGKVDLITDAMIYQLLIEFPELPV